MPHVSCLIKPVSNSCNMRCSYCFYADVSKHRETASFGVMSDETCDALIRKALNHAEGSCSFGFQGGEPTLAGLDFFKRAVKLQREYNRNNVDVRNTIQTNGYNINAEWAEFFAENYFLVGLSLDGYKEAHDSFRKDAAGRGTFDIVAATAELFDEHNVDYNILCVVNNVIASNPAEAYAALKKYKYLQFIPCIKPFDTGDNVSGDLTNTNDSIVSANECSENFIRGPHSPQYTLDTDNYAQFLKTTFDIYYNDFIRGDEVSIRNFDNYLDIYLGEEPEQCGMRGECSCYYLIEADGSAYPCDFYVLDEWKIGDINKNGLARMQNSATAKAFIDQSMYIHEDCKKCKWLDLCRGGCRRYREPVVGGQLSKNILCNAYKEFFAHADDRFQKIAIKVRERYNQYMMS